MKKHRKIKTKSEASNPLHEPEPDAGGIDVGANEIWVAVPPDRTEEPVRTFGAFTRELKAIVQWLRDCGIRTVAMESTGVYWIPLYQLLADAGLKVCLVNARHVKNVPGRKSDVRDCQWLQYLHSVGLLRASYRPDQAICAARSIYRYRQNLLTQSAQHVQHMQAALDQMNIKLHHVIDDLTGTTGLAIVEAILDGERNPRQLAKPRDHRIKASQETIVKALEGDWRSEHLFVLRVAWENWKQTQHQIQKCDQQLLEYTRQLEACTTVAGPIKIVRLSSEVAGSQPVAGPSKPRRKKTSKNEPQGPWREELSRFFGVDLTAIPSISVLTGITLMTELGNDLGAFKTAHHFSSWLCLCPDNETSASKVLRRATRRSQNRVRQALRMAASSLHHDKSYLGDKYRRLRAKLGAPKAITAMAHQLARIIWHLIAHRVSFDLTIFAAYEKANQTRRLKRLSSAARQMGYQLAPIAA
jgi:transposase